MGGDRGVLFTAVLIAAIATAGDAPADPLPRPGQRFETRASDMPAPFATESAGNRKSVV